MTTSSRARGDDPVQTVRQRMRSAVSPLMGLLLMVCATTCSLPAAAVVEAPGAIESIEPTRVLDTRRTAALGAGRTLTYTLAADRGSATAVPPVASAGFVNLTVVGATRAGYLTVFPTGSARPLSSSINFNALQPAYANHLLVKIGTGGRISIYNGSAAGVHVLLDVTGYVVAGTGTAPGTIVPRTPVRVLDTATGNGAPAGPLAARATVDVQVGGRGGVPASGVSGVWMEVTVASPTAGGYAVAWPTGGQRPLVSTLNFGPQQTVANQVFVSLGSSGRISFTNQSTGSIRLVGDVVGYTRAGDPAAEGAMMALPPKRVLDTGTGNGAPAEAIGAGRSLTVQVAGRGGVPVMGVRAVMLNLTAAAAQTGGYVTLQSRPGPRPAVSTLNFGPGRAIANMVLAPLAPDGTITLYNGSTGTVRLVADVAAQVLGPQGPADTLAISNGATAGTIEGVVSISDDAGTVAYDGVYLWDSASRRTQLMPGSPWDVAAGGEIGGGPSGILSGDGQHVLYHLPRTDDGRWPMRIWDRSDRTTVAVADAATDPGSISDDGAYVAYARPGGPGEPTSLFRWSRSNGQSEVVATVAGGQPVVSRISGDGGTIVYQVGDRAGVPIELHRWQAATDRTEKIGQGVVSDVSDDGDTVLLITTDDDGRRIAVALWSDGAITELHRSDAAFSADALSGDGRVAVWSRFEGTGAVVYRKVVGQDSVKIITSTTPSRYVSALALSDDGERLAYLERAGSADGWRYGTAVLLR